MRFRQALFITFLASLVAACGSGIDAPPPPSEGSTTMRAVDSKATGPGGVKLIVQDGELSSDTALRTRTQD